MDTKSVIARFEAERQALALMGHPNIAKVLDAGATDSGRSFFVMEFAAGANCRKARIALSAKTKNTLGWTYLTVNSTTEPGNTKTSLALKLWLLGRQTIRKQQPTP